MAAGTERDRVLRAVAELRAELNHEVVDRGWGASWSADREDPPFAGMLSAEDETLVEALDGELSRIVDAVAAAQPQAAPPARNASASALGGAALVMRSELMGGRAERLTELLPGFVYLATLPYAGRDEALRLGGRMTDLLAAQGEARGGSW